MLLDLLFSCQIQFAELAEVAFLRRTATDIWYAHAANELCALTTNTFYVHTTNTLYVLKTGISLALAKLDDKRRKSGETGRFCKQIAGHLIARWVNISATVGEMSLPSFIWKICSFYAQRLAKLLNLLIHTKTENFVK